MIKILCYVMFHIYFVVVAVLLLLPDEFPHGGSIFAPCNTQSSHVLKRPIQSCSLKVVLLALEVLSEISSNPAGLGATLDQTGEEGGMPLSLPSSVQRIVETRQGLNQYFTHFMVELITLFKKKRQLLEDMGAFIIRLVPRLCVCLFVFSCLFLTQLKSFSASYVAVFMRMCIPA